jgi:hypothetical protein
MKIRDRHLRRSSSLFVALARIRFSLIPGQEAVVAAQGKGDEAQPIEKVSPRVFQRDVRHCPARTRC